MNSQQYWRERELANIAKDYISDEALLSDIRKIYNYRLIEITKEIDSFYQRYAGGQGISYAEAKKRVSALDVKAYESTAKRLVDTRDFSEEANKQLKLYNATMRINRLELLKSQIGLHLLELSGDTSKALSKYATDMIVETYRRQAGILGDGVDIDVWKKAEQIVRGSFFGAKFSEQIWGKLETRIIGGTNILYAEISKLLERYLISGKGSIELARELQKVFNTSRYEAERLARTEVRRMQTAAQVDFMRENSITKYKFIAEPTACHLCKPLDDQVFDLDEMQIGANASPIHPNCRCSITPYIDREGLERELNARDQANDLIKQAEQAEPSATELLKSISDTTGARLQGLDYRIKGLDSLARKIGSGASSNIRDVLRYTYVSPADSYVSNYNTIIAKLREAGYNTSVVKNYWANNYNPYNGINTFVATPSGYEFEIQYYTSESFSLKNGKLHELYEKARVLDYKSDEYNELNRAMFELSSRLEVPFGVTSIKDVK